MERSKKSLIQERDLLFDMYLDIVHKIDVWRGRLYVPRKNFKKEDILQELEDQRDELSALLRILDRRICFPDMRNTDLTEVY